MEHGFRVAGTVELAGYAAGPNWRRADVLLHYAKRWFPELMDRGQTRWMGFRPSMPDSVPVIARSQGCENAFLAFGHGHLGITFGAKTGRLISDLVAGRDTGFDMQPYRTGR